MQGEREGKRWRERERGGREGEGRKEGGKERGREDQTNKGPMNKTGLGRPSCPPALYKAALITLEQID